MREGLYPPSPALKIEKVDHSQATQIAAKRGRRQGNRILQGSRKKKGPASALILAQ